jgi:Fe2+ or Zn2+ uptake regulation protein
MHTSSKKSAFAKSYGVTRERMTAQKSFIFGYLKSVKTHPSAEIVYKEVKKKLPNISQGTVYRVLKNFKDKGEIISIDTKDNVHFDADVSDHAHFICENCENVFDVMNECSKCGILKNKKTKVGKINSYKINFYGICRKCRPACAGRK